MPDKFNCEFLNRPGFGFSEMSESFPMTWDVVKEKLNMIQKKHINKFDVRMDSLDHDFKTIDKKFMPEQPRSSKEVKASLGRLNTFINTNEGHYFDKFLSNLYELGASALQMSLYYMVCSFAVRNTDLVAAKMNNNSSNAATKKFIQSKYVVSYLDLAVTDITGVSFKGTAIRPVYSLDSSEEDEEQATSSNSKRPNPFESDEEEHQCSSKSLKLSFGDDSEEDVGSGKGKNKEEK